MSNHATETLQAQKRPPFVICPYSWIFVLKPAELKVMLLLLVHENGGRAWPSLQRMERLSGMCRQTIVKALTGLEERKLIRKRHQTNVDGGRSSNLYEILDVSGEGLVIDSQVLDKLLTDPRTQQVDATFASLLPPKEMGEGIGEDHPAPTAEITLPPVKNHPTPRVETTLPQGENHPLTRSNELDLNELKKEPELTVPEAPPVPAAPPAVSLVATRIETPEGLRFASREINAWIRLIKTRGARNEFIQQCLTGLDQLHAKWQNEEQFKRFMAHATTRGWRSLQPAWFDDWMQRHHEFLQSRQDAPGSPSMASSRENPRNTLFNRLRTAVQYVQVDDQILPGWFDLPRDRMNDIENDYDLAFFPDTEQNEYRFHWEDVEEMLTTQEAYEKWKAANQMPDWL